MKEKTRLLKEDINFLINPNWIVSKKIQTHSTPHKNGFGSYELVSTSCVGLPTRFDKVLLYFLIHKLFTNNLEYCSITISRYAIAKNILNQRDNFSTSKYKRITLSLERWQSVILKFERSFLEKDNYTTRHFRIIDSFTLDKQTKKLIIHFNQDYIRQLREAEIYKFIDFGQYKKLSSPVSLRLYELLLKNFVDKNITWHIDIKTLARELTFKKSFYASQVLVALEPAIEEINKKTELPIKFEYIKNIKLCIFKKILPQTAK